jgi:hypothetical protein
MLQWLIPLIPILSALSQSALRPASRYGGYHPLTNYPIYPGELCAGLTRSQQPIPVEMNAKTCALHDAISSHQTALISRPSLRAWSPED